MAAGGIAGKRALHADKLQSRARVTACFFGDGAVAEGEFHESLNLAALWTLPVLFLCENNLYAMGTALWRHQSQTDIRRKAQAYDVRAEAVDGMDVLAVEEAARRAADLVRGGSGPFLLELRTYRFRAHSMADPDLYRTKEEIEGWKQRDPDVPTILSSVAKTHRAVIVDEGWRMCSFAAEVSAQIMEGAFFELDAPVGRVCSAEVPMPYAPETDYARLSTLDRCVEYLAARVPAGRNARGA